MTALRLSAVERAPIYALLARLLIEEVDAPTWESLRTPDVAAFLEQGRPGFADWIAAPASDAALEDLAEEFASLFLVPNGVPLFASAWLEGDRERMAKDLSEFVQNAMTALERQPIVRPPWGRLPMDHLALWLDLIVSAADASPEFAEELVEQLMGPWVAQLGAALEKKARSPLYKAVGALLDALHR